MKLTVFVKILLIILCLVSKMAMCITCLIGSIDSESEARSTMSTTECPVENVCLRVDITVVKQESQQLYPSTERNEYISFKILVPCPLGDH